MASQKAATSKTNLEGFWRMLLLMGVVAAIVVGIFLVMRLESTPQDPADVLEFAQANDLLTADEVEAALGPEVTGGWIIEDDEVNCVRYALKMPDELRDVVEFEMRECDFVVAGGSEAAEELFASHAREMREDQPPDAIYEPALVGGDSVVAVAYEYSGERWILVRKGDAVIEVQVGEDLTREQADNLVQAAVDKLVDWSR